MNTCLTALASPNTRGTEEVHQSACDAPLCYRLSASRRLLEGCGISAAGGGEAKAVSDSRNGEIPNVPECLLSRQQHSVIGVEKVRRLALMVTPHPEGEFLDRKSVV